MSLFTFFSGSGSNAFKNQVKAINNNEALSDTGKMEAIDLLLNPIIVSYNPLINYDWSTTTTSGLRYLNDIESTPTYDASMYFGRGAYFNGKQSIVTDIKPDFKNGGTVLARATFVSPTVNRCIIGCNDAINRLYIAVSNTGNYFIGIGSAYSSSIPANLIIGKEYLFRLNYDGLGNATFYVDDVLILSISATVTGATTVGIGIGGRGAETNFYYIGVVKDCFIFNRALTQDEIIQAYEQPESFYDMAQDDSACVLNMPLCEISSTSRNYKTGTDYAVANYTSSVRDNAKNLQYGLQTCKFVRNSLGVIQSSSDYLECDKVGTAVIPNHTEKVNIKMTVNPTNLTGFALSGGIIKSLDGLTLNVDNDIVINGVYITEPIIMANGLSGIIKNYTEESINESIDYTTREYRTVPSEFDISLVPTFEVWKNKNSRIFETNIKATKVFEDLEADKIVYVDLVNGLDTNDGSVHSPFKTLTKGISVKPFVSRNGGNLSVYVKAGVFTDSEGFNEAIIYADKINIIAYDGFAESVQTDLTKFNLVIPSSKQTYIENIIVNGGKRPLYGFFDAYTDNLIMGKNCTFKNGSEATGYYFNGNGVSILENCFSTLNNWDGFGYSNNPNPVAARNNLAIEINCIATHNGKEGYVNNGSTIHDNSKIIRINGVYNYNGNRNVHDVGDSKSWNLGCEASYGVQLDQYNFALGIGVNTDFSKMWLDTCTSEGNNFGTGPYQSASPTIYAYDYVDNCTQISTYTPIAYDYKE